MQKTTSRLIFLTVLSFLAMGTQAKTALAAGLNVGFVAGYNKWQAKVSAETGGNKSESSSSKDAFLGTLSLGYDWGLPFMFLRTNFLLRQAVPKQSASTNVSGDTINHTLSQDMGFGCEALVGIDLPLLPAPYLKVALTGAQAKHATNLASSNNTYKKLLWSPSIGGGLKMSFLGLMGSIEYLYTSMPNMSHNATLSGTSYGIEAKGMQMHTVALTVSYAF